MIKNGNNADVHLTNTCSAHIRPVQVILWTIFGNALECIDLQRLQHLETSRARKNKRGHKAHLYITQRYLTFQYNLK